MNFFEDLADNMFGTSARARCDRQFQLANKNLDLAIAALTAAEPDYQQAQAAALTGLLALELSKR